MQNPRPFDVPLPDQRSGTVPRRRRRISGGQPPAQPGRGPRKSILARGRLGSLRASGTKSAEDNLNCAYRKADHVEAVSSALAAYGKSVRKAIDETDELGDRDSADIFTEISRGTDRWLWFVEAHIG